MKGPKKRNEIQKVNRAEKILAKKATDKQIEKILKEDEERAIREVKRQEALEWAGARIRRLTKQRRILVGVIVGYSVISVTSAIIAAINFLGA
jgi:uncharacterized membrane-anchored protein YjiN (DUF445 family)